MDITHLGRIHAGNSNDNHFGTSGAGWSSMLSAYFPKRRICPVLGLRVAASFGVKPA